MRRGGDSNSRGSSPTAFRERHHQPLGHLSAREHTNHRTRIYAILIVVNSARVKELAIEAGFDLVGIAPAEPFEPEGRALAERIEAGLFDGLPWFTAERAATASDPRALLPEARSIIALGLSYDTGDGPAGAIARYAWGDDYHDVIRERLAKLRDRLTDETDGFEARTFVDTGRLVDRGG
jgi:epoxyqueuosine reductase